MIPIIKGHGGQVLVDAKVTEILIDDRGRANGKTLYFFLMVEPACGKARRSCYNLCSVYVRVCMRALVCACVRASGFVRAITSTFMQGFQNNLAQLLSLRSSSAVCYVCSGILKVKVTLEGHIN